MHNMWQFSIDNLEARLRFHGIARDSFITIAEKQEEIDTITLQKMQKLWAKRFDVIHFAMRFVSIVGFTVDKSI